MECGERDRKGGWWKGWTGERECGGWGRNGGGVVVGGVVVEIGMGEVWCGRGRNEGGVVVGGVVVRIGMGVWWWEG